MKGNHLILVGFLWYLWLLVGGCEAKAAAPRLPFYGDMQTKDALKEITGAEEPDSVRLFPESILGLTYREVVSSFSIAKVNKHQEAFYKWMSSINGGRWVSDDRWPILSYLYWLKGTLRLSEGDVDNALIDLSQSLDAAKRLKAPVDSMVPKILNNLALANEVKKNYPQAIKYYQSCVSFFENREGQYLKKQWLFFSLNNLASLFDKMGDYAQADKYYRKTAVLLNLDTISSKNSFFVVNLLSFYQNSGQIESFHQLQTRSDIYFSGTEASVEEKAFYLNLTGGMYLMEGNYRKAILFKNQALTLSKMSGNKQLTTEIESQLVHCYFSEGDYDAAQRMASEILKTSSVADHALKTKMAVLLAKIYSFQGKPEMALKLLDGVQKSLPQLKNRSVFKLSVLYNAGLTYTFLKEYKKAELCFRARLDLVDKYFSENHTLGGNSYYSLGLTRLYLGDLDQAELFFLKSLGIIEHGDSSRFSLTDHKLSLLAHLSLAKICKRKWLETGDRERIACGISHVNSAVAMVDQFKNEIEFDQDRITNAGRVEEILDVGVWLSAQNYLLAPSDSSYNLFFAYSQRKKNNSLMTAIRKRTNRVRANLPPTLFASEKEFKSKIFTLQYHLKQENEKEVPDQKKINYWQANLVSSYRGLDSIKEIIRRGYSEYYELKYRSPFILLNQAQSHLKANQAFMDLFLNDDFVLINLITRDTVVVVQKQMATSLVPVARTFIKEVSSPFNGFSTRSEIQSFFESSYALYEAFVEPVDSILRGKKIIFSPDARLALVPFEALVTRKPDAHTLFNNAPWLIHEHSVSYLYNAALLASVNEEGQYYRQLTGFAPDYHGTAAAHDSVLLEIREGLNSRLRPIPGAIEEVKQVSRLFKGKRFIGSEASIAHFEQRLQADEILHLAMHSLISSQDPMGSKLVFSPSGGDSSGVLEAYTIYNFQTNAPLIALSSCNSGMGAELAGEGVMSLSRAFTFAGAKSTLMTLWAVNDKAASRLVGSFYSNLRGGMAKDEALTNAKLAFLSTASPLYAHPYYWANYVISGNQSPLIPRYSWFDRLGLRTMGLSIAILLLLVFGWLKVRNHKRKPL